MIEPGYSVYRITDAGKCNEEPLNQPDILGAQLPSLYHHGTRHGSHGTA